MSTLAQTVLSMFYKLVVELFTLPYYSTVIHRWLSVIIYTVFLFLVITVLLNLLIAQMSDTYTNVQSDAQRSLAINRAWIIARVENNTLFSLVSQ